ncbi:unnamed protein product, partial [Brenthis ino]
MSIKLSTCCLCFPLRTGLLVWGYFGLVISYLFVLHTLCRMTDILDGGERPVNTTFIYLSMSMASMVVHFMFYVLLIVGLHKKSKTLLEIFYGFSVIVMILTSTISSLYIPLQTYKLYPLVKFDIWQMVLMYSGIAVLLALLQLYLVVSVRSVISTLEEVKECSTLEPIEDLCVLHKYNPYKEYYEEC